MNKIVNEYSIFFTNKTTTLQLRSVLFSLITKDTTAQEKKKITEAYKSAAAAVLKREMNEAEAGWMD